MYLSLASGYPDEEAFAAVYRALRSAGTGNCLTTVSEPKNGAVGSLRGAKCF